MSPNHGRDRPDEPSWQRSGRDIRAAMLLRTIWEDKIERRPMWKVGTLSTMVSRFNTSWWSGVASADDKAVPNSLQTYQPTSLEPSSGRQTQLHAVDRVRSQMADTWILMTQTCVAEHNPAWGSMISDSDQRVKTCSKVSGYGISRSDKSCNFYCSPILLASIGLRTRLGSCRSDRRCGKENLGSTGAV